MHIFVPLVLVFGFLLAAAEKDAGFPIIVPLALLAITTPAVIVFGTRRARDTRFWMTFGVLVVLSFVVGVIIARVTDMSFGAGFGPQLLNVPLAFVFVWLPLLFASSLIAERFVSQWLLQGMLAGFCAFWLTLVIVAGLEGLTIVSTENVLHLAVWPVGIVFCHWLLRWLWGSGQLPLKMVQSSALLVALCTGAAMAAGLFLPGVIGLLVLLFHFHVRHYL